MKPVSWLLAVAVLLSGCSQGGADLTTASDAGRGEVAPAGAPFRAGAPAERVARPFADLPDRGDLLVYSAPVRRGGAYTWHAARLSETHAINAIVTGGMTVSAPDGTPIRLRYDHHIEHPDGNWTWVGTTADGGQALITFGPTAAFGSIPQGRGRLPLRLTTADGVAWVVTTDRDALARVDSEATDPTGPDYFVPPKVAPMAGAAPGPGIRPAAAAPAAVGTTASAPVIDLLIGYTDGFAAAHGGQPGARTRIQYLVDVTNQAYVNSGIDARVRLVHAMQVNYPDATDNGTALEELTGFKAPSTQTTPDPVFAALRSARDQYGADLVSLVRKFQTPENGNCGTAWLIGGDMSGIRQSDEYFGYSVVSDGTDADTDGRYFCRDETLAHELGHNMGSQHDAATANDEPGLYEFSFGYKTVAGNFYTVMAYGDDAQDSYQVFSNPATTFCGGRPCGVANEADNARSLKAAMPLVMNFRASKAARQAVAFDFDGDGRSDLFWRNLVYGQNILWPSAHRPSRRNLVSVPSQQWRVVGSGDFDGDGRADILWRNFETGDNTIWPAGESSAKQRLERITGTGWRIGPIADFTGDGRSDILWVNPITGQNSIWPSAVRADRLAVATIKNLDWKVVAAADFDGDGRADMLLRNMKTGANLLWPAADSSRWRSLATVAHLGWKVVATGDFSGDGAADVLWHRDATGESSIWPSADRSRRRALMRLRDTSYRIGAVGDYNGDGRSDIVLRSRRTGGNVLWPSAISSAYRVLPSVTDDNWHLLSF